MRGTPFLKKDFSRGLNTQDSPYTLKDGEARMLCNVQSSTRGAIRKRTGVVQFTSTAAFPSGSMSTLYSLEGANEEPFVPAGGAVFPNADPLQKKGRIHSAHWETESVDNIEGVYKEVGISNPAASIKVSVLPGETAERYFM